MTECELQSWGGLRAKQSCIAVNWRHEPLAISKSISNVLPYGLGRSYGDSCLNEGGGALLTRGLNRWIDFDPASGLLTCEAGVALGDLARWALPKGFFLPVSPGTQFVTVGGAIANDVHGKNHHVDGSFGAHVLELTLQRSDGTTHLCSLTRNAELFRATIGGLGLTGLIVAAKIQLKPVHGPFIDQEQIRFSSIREALSLADDSINHTYVVSWIDCLSADSKGGIRGILYRGNHSQKPGTKTMIAETSSPLSVPVYLPSWFLNKASVKTFNRLYEWKGRYSSRTSTVPYQPFFYPLDAIHHWNRIYGRGGLLQYQCVVPFENAEDSMTEILSTIAKSGMGSFLAVLKSFGTHPPAGMLSFARPGVTLALDFRNNGEPVHLLFKQLDEIVRLAGGALYPAKDQRMSSEMFRESFPDLNEFSEYMDPRFSSSFWRRIFNG